MAPNKSRIGLRKRSTLSPSVVSPIKAPIKKAPSAGENPAWVDASLFGNLKILEIDPTEEYAANTLLIGETVIYPISYPRTRQRLIQAGITVQAVDVSELIKAEGAVTCCSLIFRP